MELGTRGQIERVFFARVGRKAILLQEVTQMPTPQAGMARPLIPAVEDQGGELASQVSTTFGQDHVLDSAATAGRQTFTCRVWCVECLVCRACAREVCGVCSRDLLLAVWSGAPFHLHQIRGPRQVPVWTLFLERAPDSTPSAGNHQDSLALSHIKSPQGQFKAHRQGVSRPCEQHVAVTQIQLSWRENLMEPREQEQQGKNMPHTTSPPHLCHENAIPALLQTVSAPMCCQQL